VRSGGSDSEQTLRSVHSESARPQGIPYIPEVWYSLVTEIRADDDVFNATEVNTTVSICARGRRVCRGPQGVAWLKRSTQELGRPCMFLPVQGMRRVRHGRGNPDTDWGDTYGQEEVCPTN